MIGIYKIENQINGKIYIGQSIDIEKRWNKHILDSKDWQITEQSAVIHKAINKYGVNNFSFSVLEECNLNELDDKEIYWIEYYDSYYKGYNCTKGGSRNTDHFKKKVYYYNLKGDLLGSFESIKEAGEKLSIYPSLISNCCLGKAKTAHGFQFSYKKENKSSCQVTKGNEKRVGQFTKDGIFIKEYPSASEAARAMNITKYSIADCCRGKQKTSVGYIWKYL